MNKSQDGARLFIERLWIWFGWFQVTMTSRARPANGQCLFFVRNILHFFAAWIPAMNNLARRAVRTTARGVVAWAKKGTAAWNPWKTPRFKHVSDLFKYVPRKYRVTPRDVRFDMYKYIYKYQIDLHWISTNTYKYRFNQNLISGDVQPSLWTEHGVIWHNCEPSQV